MLLQWCADAQALNNAGQLPSEIAPTSQMTALIRDASMAEGRCQCDCGPYTPGPLFDSFNWDGGCAATVKCHLDEYESTSEGVRCTASNAGSRWEPALPSLTCSAVTSGSARCG